MTVNNYPYSLNTKFFSFLKKPKGNTSTITFISGREVSTKNNTKNIMTYSFRVEYTPTELNNFWTWYNDVLGQNANAFTCSAIGTGVYKFTDIPEPEETNNANTILSCNIEEVY